jgi:hypothetical protein
VQDAIRYVADSAPFRNVDLKVTELEAEKHHFILLPLFPASFTLAIELRYEYNLSITNEPNRWLCDLQPLSGGRMGLCVETNQNYHVYEFISHPDVFYYYCNISASEIS